MIKFLAQTAGYIGGMLRRLARRGGPKQGDSGGQRFILVARVLRLWSRLARLIDVISAAAAAAARRLFRPDRRTKTPTPWRFRLWVAANCAVLLLAMSAPSLAWAALPVLFANLALAIGGLRTLAEDLEVMSGYVNVDPAAGVDHRRVKDGDVLKKKQVFGAAILFYVVSGSVLLKALFATGLNADTLSPAESLTQNAAYLAGYLMNLPGVDAIAQRLMTPPPLTASLTGEIVEALLYTLNFSLIIGGLTVLFSRENEMRRLMETLGETGPEALSASSGEAVRADMALIQQRAAKAPGEFKRDMIEAAFSGARPRTRRRAMGVLRHMRAFTFSYAMIFKLHREPEEELRLLGLDIVLEVIRSSDDRLAMFHEQINNALMTQHRRRNTFSAAVVERLDAIGAETGLADAVAAREAAKAGAGAPADARKADHETKEEEDQETKDQAADPPPLPPASSWP